LLEAFKLESNLKDSQPLLNAIQLILEHRDLSGPYYPEAISAPVDKVISSKWHTAVVVHEGKTSGNKEQVIRRINRINYELAVFETFRKLLGCKMI